MHKLSPRQVHLDFHTSPLIPGIGSNYSREDFQKALKDGHLSSITVFAKCHHGVCYYPTKVGTMHPGLDFDLLGEMIDAAHEVGVRAPVYITAGWSAHDAEQHPEWWVRKKGGETASPHVDLNAAPDDPRPECNWIHLCLNDGSYCQHIYDITREICDRYEHLDGLFYDICFIGEVCYCDECVAGMKAMGLDPENEADAKAYYIRKRQDFMTKCGEIMREKHPDATIFFNSGGADPYRPEYHAYETHYEMEDLPTVWGGYDKMPCNAKFFSKTGKGYLGMTGKFHMGWGEFGGFKPGFALKFEVASMMAYGACCSIGDQLHPDGKFDPETYRNIGEAYSYVEKIEDYCLDGESCTKLGVYLSGNSTSDEGMVKMLLETQNDFEIVYQDDYTPFDTVIFPDCVKLSDASAEKLQAFIARGGKVLFTGESLVKDGVFQIDPGAAYAGSHGFNFDYITVGDKVAEGMVTSPMYCYTPGAKIDVTDGEVLATATMPYFNRTYGAYCSHKNTPYDRNNGGHPAMVRKGNVIYISHNICRLYKEYGSVYYKSYFINALNLLYTDKIMEAGMTSAGRATLIKQPGQKLYSLNLMYGSPIRRDKVEVIEDLPVIRDIPVTLRVPETVTKVFQPVSGKELPFEQKDGAVKVTVPELQCHELVVFCYA